MDFLVLILCYVMLFEKFQALLILLAYNAFCLFSWCFLSGTFLKFVVANICIKENMWLNHITDAIFTNIYVFQLLTLFL